MINFISGGQGHGIKSRYQILLPNSVPKSLPKPVPKSLPKPVPLKKTKTKTKPPVCPPQADDDAVAAVEKLNEIEFVDKVVLYFNSTCKNLRPVKSITEKRRASVLARYREHGKEAIQITIEKAAKSEFMGGQGAKGWTADFDWIFRPLNFLKTYEGNFDTKTYQNGQQGNNIGGISGIKPGGKLASAMQGLADDIDALSNKYSQ